MQCQLYPVPRPASSQWAGGRACADCIDCPARPSGSRRVYAEKRRRITSGVPNRLTRRRGHRRDRQAHRRPVPAAVGRDARTGPDRGSPSLHPERRASGRHLPERCFSAFAGPATDCRPAHPASPVPTRLPENPADRTVESPFSPSLYSSPVIGGGGGASLAHNQERRPQSQHCRQQGQGRDAETNFEKVFCGQCFALLSGRLSNQQCRQ